MKGYYSTKEVNTLFQVGSIESTCLGIRNHFPKVALQDKDGKNGLPANFYRQDEIDEVLRRFRASSQPTARGRMREALGQAVTIHQKARPESAYGYLNKEYRAKIDEILEIVRTFKK